MIPMRLVNKVLLILGDNGWRLISTP